MESDRIAVLTIDAALEGVIDFSQARLLDARWWRRYYILLKALSRKKQGEVDRGRFDYYAGLISARLSDKSFKDVQSNLQDAFYDYTGAHQPWNGKSAKDKKSAEFQNARQAYIDSFGVDPLDPAFKEWEAKAIAAALADSGQSAESDDEKVIRRLREKNSTTRPKQGRRRHAN